MCEESAAAGTSLRRFSFALRHAAQSPFAYCLLRFFCACRVPRGASRIALAFAAPIKKTAKAGSTLRRLLLLAGESSEQTTGGACLNGPQSPLLEPQCPQRAAAQGCRPGFALPLMRTAHRLQLACWASAVVRAGRARPAGGASTGAASGCRGGSAQRGPRPPHLQRAARSEAFNQPAGEGDETQTFGGLVGPWGSPVGPRRGASTRPASI